MTYTQTVNSGAADNTTISNTATVSDPKTGDTNDSSTASTKVNKGATDSDEDRVAEYRRRAR